MSYYPSRFGYDENIVRNAAWVSDSSIALPVGPHVDETDMVRVATTLKAAVP